MTKAYEPNQLEKRVFYLTLTGISLQLAIIFWLVV
jgi:hypothetical protein